LNVTLKKSKDGWKAVVPVNFKVDPEQQFPLVVKKYLQYLREGTMPEPGNFSDAGKILYNDTGIGKALNQ
jgi:hypothetical protein